MSHHDTLRTSPLHSFEAWPPSEAALPRVSAGVYTIWKGPRLYYVGMAGKNLTAEHIANANGTKVQGLRQRLAAHRSGRRSGDQFCVYVADYEVIPSLTQAQQRAIRARELHVDHLVRDFVQSQLQFRFQFTADGRSALALEREVVQGALGEVPELNAWARGGCWPASSRVISNFGPKARGGRDVKRSMTVGRCPHPCSIQGSVRRYAQT